MVNYILGVVSGWMLIVAYMEAKKGIMKWKENKDARTDIN